MKDGNAGDQKTLLLIDDDPNLNLLVKDYLEFRGYSVITAENGREALDILNGHNPDMIICDVMMPEMDGYAFVEHVLATPRPSGFQFSFSLPKVKAKIGSKASTPVLTSIW